VSRRVCIVVGSTEDEFAVRQANLLIVDDDPLVRMDLKTVLTGMGFAVMGEADSGGVALTMARTLRPDLVLLDLVLPSISGLDVARTLVSERIAPVVIFSGNAAPELVAQVSAAGAMGFLSKPVRPADLGPAIAIAIERFREVVQLEQEVRSLEERMEARKMVGRAKAILMEKFGLTEREAFYRIQGQSATLNRPVHEIARAIITASEMHN
jgi:Response regulator with putative antiterminator output domain